MASTSKSPQKSMVLDPPQSPKKSSKPELKISPVLPYKPARYTSKPIPDSCDPADPILKICVRNLTTPVPIMTLMYMKKSQVRVEYLLGALEFHTGDVRDIAAYDHNSTKLFAVFHDNRTPIGGQTDVGALFTQNLILIEVIFGIKRIEILCVNHFATAAGCKEGTLMTDMPKVKNPDQCFTINTLLHTHDEAKLRKPEKSQEVKNASALSKTEGYMRQLIKDHDGILQAAEKHPHVRASVVDLLLPVLAANTYSQPFLEAVIEQQI